MEDVSVLMVDIQREFPKFEVRHKSSSALMRAINVFLMVITFGQMRKFMVDFATTVGYTVYVPSAWDRWSDTAKVILLRHERVHMKQRAKYGAVLFTFLYLFAFFPVGLAYYRAKFEKEAYEETLRAMLDVSHMQDAMWLLADPLKRRIVGHFTTSSYFWMWPWKKDIERWYDDTVRRLIGP